MVEIDFKYVGAPLAKFKRPIVIVDVEQWRKGEGGETKTHNTGQIEKIKSLH